MKHIISPDRRTLTITVNGEEREELRKIRECGGDCQCDVSMHDFLEPITCNSELDWVQPENCGDLTDAPMLGILSEPEFRQHNIETVRNHRNIIASCSTHGLMVCKVVERWAFMDYQVRSVLEDLRDKGEVTFIGGPL